MHHRNRSVLVLFLVAVFLVACSPAATPVAPTPTAPPSAGIANPASENCIKQGGKLSILKRGDGGEYGVCVFPDNRQCEEWAMLRGGCPVGGIDVSGYVTQPARHCALTGGEYKVTSNAGGDKEQGICSFKTGKTCDAWEYFNGTCSPNS